MKTATAESQKGVNAVQRRSLEDQKGAITIDFAVHSDCTPQVFNETSLKSINALLALNWRLYMNSLVHNPYITLLYMHTSTYFSLSPFDSHYAWVRYMLTQTRWKKRVYNHVWGENVATISMSVAGYIKIEHPWHISAGSYHEEGVVRYHTTTAILRGKNQMLCTAVVSLWRVLLKYRILHQCAGVHQK